MVELPSTLISEVDALVSTGVFPSRDVAVVELVRLGLESFRSRAPRPPRPGPPGPPPRRPGVTDPGDDRPISVDPRDTKWL